MKRVTPARAAKMLLQLERDFSERVPMRISRRLSKLALMLSVTKYMQPLRSGGRDKRGRATKHTAMPPNPPPGPLGIRSGNLRRAVRILQPEIVGSGVAMGLTVDLQKAPYGRIHEFGGTINHPGSVASKGSALRWFDASNEPVFRRSTRPHQIRIPPRPYLRPAIIDAYEEAPDVSREETAAMIAEWEARL